MQIGHKIRFFRKRAKFSQQQLELAINASFGSISRIENNETNPTKETLDKIIDLLNLDYLASSYLFGQKVTNISQIDIDNAIAKLNIEVDSFNGPAYIIDFKRNIYYWNRFTEIIFGLNIDRNSENYPNLYSIYFDPRFSIKNNFSESEYFKLGKELLCLFEYELGYMSNEEINEIQKSLEQFEAYRKCKTEFENIKYDMKVDSYQMEVLTKMGKLKLETSNNKFNEDPRFFIVKYYSLDTKSIELIKKLSGSD